MPSTLFDQGLQTRREVLLQAAVYCGVPAGGEAFRIARKVFTESK